MKVGCVKEIKNNEFRVGMTPDNVKSLRRMQDMKFTSRKAAGAGLRLHRRRV